VTVFNLDSGRFSDIFGRKVATLFASSFFLIGSLGCGLSQTFWQLIAARAIAGIGGGGLTTMSSIVTSDLVPLRSRGTYQGLGNLVYAAGAAIGGPLGGWLGDTIGWRWAFLIQGRPSSYAWMHPRRLMLFCSTHLLPSLCRRELEGQHPKRTWQHVREAQENRLLRCSLYGLGCLIASRWYQYGGYVY
jgi:MFS family permease